MPQAEGEWMYLHPSHLLTLALIPQLFSVAGGEQRQQDYVLRASLMLTAAAVCSRGGLAEVCLAARRC